MNNRMLKNLTTAADEETTAIKDYKDLAAAQKKETDTITVSIKSTTQRIDELTVSIAHTKNDLTDNKEALLDDTEFMDWQEMTTARKENEELIAAKKKEMNLLHQ